MKQLLRDLAEIGAGQGAPQGDSNYCDDGTPFVKAGNLESLTTGAPLGSIQKVSDSVAKEHRLKLYPKGTVLFAKSGMSCLKGYVYVLPKDAYVVSHLACVTPKEDLSEYLRYYFLYRKPNQLVKDASYPSISLADIGDLEIDAKDKQTRKHIIATLSLVERVIQLRQKQLSALDDLIKARFVEMSSRWEREMRRTPLYNYIKFITYGFTNPMPDADIGPWKITAKDIINGVVNYATARRTTQESYDLLTEKCKPVKGDVLLTKDGTLGRLAVVDQDGICVNQSVAVLRPNERILPAFLMALLNSPECQREMIANSGGGTIKHLYITKVDKMEVVVPRLDEQEEFISFVSQINKSKSVIQKSLDETQLLFDSLMQKYFG